MADIRRMEEETQRELDEVFLRCGIKLEGILWAGFEIRVGVSFNGRALITSANRMTEINQGPDKLAALYGL